MHQDSVRHGETVFSEAGVSQSAEGRWSQDTGIQLAAAQAEEGMRATCCSHANVADACYPFKCLGLDAHVFGIADMCPCPQPYASMSTDLNGYLALFQSLMQMHYCQVLLE